MILNIKGAKLFVKFQHNTTVKYSSTTSKAKKHRIPRSTTCTISNEEGIILADGVSFVHPTDHQFDKEKGRQLSLSRAISGWEKDARSQAWETYRTWGKERF